MIFKGDTPNSKTLKILTFFSSILFCSIKSYRRRNKEHEDAILDRWVSREKEDQMRSRLEQEQLEASGDSMGSGWSQMEKKHLETTLNEEE